MAGFNPFGSLQDLASGAAKAVGNITDEAAKAAKDAADSTGFAVDVIASGAGTTAESLAMAAKDGIHSAGSIAASLSSGVIDTASGAVDNIQQAVDTAAQHLAGQARAQAEKEHREISRGITDALAHMESETGKRMIAQLGPSPTKITHSTIAQAQETFPIPREQRIVWMSAEFDLRPSGIVVTDRGVFFKSDVDPLSIIDPRAEESSKHAILTYFTWEGFEPAWFANDDEPVPVAMAGTLLAPFSSACHALNECFIAEETSVCAIDNLPEYQFEQNRTKQATAAATMTPVAHDARFAYEHTLERNNAGHGEMAERALNMSDRARGHKVEWEGRNNAKNGADRIVGSVEIQTKYCRSATRSLNAAFDKNGMYRYVGKDAKPMQLEVPKDQYEKVVAGFRKKIADGKVPGVSDPDQAAQLVRKGRLTYAQARNLAKPGTVESLSYDAKTGAVACSCAFGVSFVFTTFTTYRQTSDIAKSVQAGAVIGVQTFGISFIQHMLASQIARTSVADALIAPSQFIVEKMGYRATQTVVNGLRALSGKTAISGAAASNQLAKVLRGNVVTTAVTMAVFAVPETYRLANRRISGAQYAKNIANLTGSIIGGAAGAVAAGAAASKVAAAAGTAVLPGVGTAVGFAGGFIGGAAASTAVNAVGSIIHEDDAEIAGRFFNAMISVMASEYLLDDKEMETLVKRLDEIPQDDYKKLFEDFNRSDCQEQRIRDFLTPIFDTVVSERSVFKLPTPSEVFNALNSLVIGGDKSMSEGSIA